MNFSEYEFRCSSLGKLMTEPKSKSETLSETTRSYLNELFIAEKYSRTREIESKYLAKGLMVEEDSLTLYSQHKKSMFLKNDVRKGNKFITGHPDIVTDLIIDIKSSWDIFSFFKSVKSKTINKDYYWQLQGYMELFNLDSSRLVYCLVNTPEVIRNDEMRKLQWKLNVLNDEDPTYIEACKELDKLLVYDDIPINERVYEIVIERDYENFSTIYDRIDECRIYLNNLANGTT